MAILKQLQGAQEARGRRMTRRGGARAVRVCVALGSALLILGSPWATEIVPGRTAIASTVGVHQSFGAHNVSGSATLSASPSAATTAGDLLVATIRSRNATALAPVISITDTNAGDHWVRAAGITQGSQGDGEIWYVTGAASLATSQAVTVTLGGASASTSAIAVTVLDVTGASTSPLDGTSTKSGSAPPVSTGTTPTTAQASEIAIGDIGWNSSVTPSAQSAGYTTTAVEQSTVSGNAAGEQAAWQLLTATGVQGYSATLSSSSVGWTGAIATFKVGTSPPPTITSFSPTSGSVGTPVVITGSGFTGASAAAFNATAAAYTVTDDSHINTSVPSGATTGPIMITAPGGAVTSSATFTVNPPAPPAITGFSPTSGSVGTPVVITGSGFTGAGAVAFNATAAAYTVTDGSHINTSVPSGATTGPIMVTAPGGSVTSSASFTVNPSLPPAITSFSPTSGSVGTPVVITGSGFTGASAVAFNATATTYAVTDDSHINTSVPSGATTGPIMVAAPGGSVTSSASFTVNPAPTSPHVMVVAEANREYGSIIGSSNAPYLNSLATTYASATNWYAVQHTSQNDLVELLSGSNQGLPNGIPYSAATVVDEQHTKGIPWQAYVESMPSNCFNGTTTNGLYDPAHNPFHYFTNYNSTQSAGWCNSANLSTEGVLTYPGSAALVSTLNGANAPDFVWLTPNDCNDMHGDTNTGSTCKSSTTSQLVKAGDSWLSSNIGPVISSPWFSQNGIIIITWDEGTTNLGCCGLTTLGGHIATIVVASNNKGRGQFTGSGDHYGTLGAIENAFGVPRLLNSANAVNGDLSGAFANPTGGSISGTVTDAVTKAAISGATVSDGAGGTTTSNSSGVYTLSNVAPATYTVTASDTGYATQSASPVTVTNGATTTQNFSLVPQPGTISGKVTDFVTAVGIAGATVSYTGPGGSSGSSTTASDGTYSLATLSEGSYTVTAAASGHNSQTITITVAPGATTAHNFTLSTSSGSPIQHIVVLYQENHSFDNVLGAWCAQNGRCLGLPSTVTLKGGVVVTPTQATDLVPDMGHAVGDQVAAIDGAKMDGWAGVSGCSSPPYACVSYYSPTQVPNITALAGGFAVSDHFFTMADSPSFGGHLYAVAASMDGFNGNNPHPHTGVTPGQGWGCDSNLDATWAPSPGAVMQQVPSCVPDPSLNPSTYPYGGAYRTTPVGYVPTIMDRLNSAGRSWRLYTSGVSTAGGSGSGGQYSWSICPTFAECLDTGDRMNMVPVTNFLTDAKNGTLPNFSIVLPQGSGTLPTSQHNGTSMAAGDNWIGQVASALEQGPEWQSTALFITYDDCGCFYDHLAPGVNPDGTPQGIRVPLLIVSPYARAAYTDSTPATFASILAFTEQTFGLAALGANDAGAYPLSNSFDFSQVPRAGVGMVQQPVTNVGVIIQDPNDPT